MHPFEIDGAFVEGLGHEFTPFVNRLLQAERADQGVDNANLIVTSNENIGDGGVDAQFRASTGSPDVPAGDSAWQFKRGNLSPKACRDEYAGASFAQEIVGSGGAYCLVLGKSIPAELVRDRREALEVEIGGEADVRVLNADNLADWANKYPAVLRHVGRSLGSLIPHDRWERQKQHESPWAPDAARDRNIDALATSLRQERDAVVRIEGPPGIGKTRLALQLLSAPDFAPLVLYADQAEGLDQALFNYITESEKPCILVLDECDRRTARRFAGSLQSGGKTRLVTIGPNEAGGGIDHPLVELSSVDESTLDDLIKNSFPRLDTTRRRWVATHSDGNPRHALVLAELLQDSDEAHAGHLMRQAGFAAIASELLDEESQELLRGLSLLRRVGWEGSVIDQRGSVIAYAGVAPAKANRLLAAAKRAGLVAQQGRYVYVTPETVAISLAAEEWEADADRILTALFDTLDRDGQQSLIARTADLGRFEPAQRALEALLGEDGPFGTLDAIENSESGRTLEMLSVLLPEQALARLETLLEPASDEELKAIKRSRRSLVHALERSAWPTSTFKRAANLLIALAVAENEAWANNATGTWIDLFGARLPATGARSYDRAAYLRSKATDSSLSVRILAAKGAGRALQVREFSTVSAELQFGVAVEPAGRVSSTEEDVEYRSVALGILGSLSKDKEESVAREATEQLASSMLEMTDHPAWSEFLAAAAQVPDTYGRRLRLQAKQWLAANESVGDADDPRAIRLRGLLELIEDATAKGRIRDLAETRPWAGDQESLTAESSALLTEIEADGDLATFLAELLSADLPGGYTIGAAVGQSRARDNVNVIGALIDASGQNPAALAGYLDALAPQLSPDDRDEFLDAHRERIVPSTLAALSLTTEPTDRGVQRVVDLGVSGAVGPSFAARLGWGHWSRNVPVSDFSRLVEAWIEQVASGVDLAGVLDLLAMHLGDSEELPPSLKEPAWHAFELRAKYPDIGTARWDWGKLGKHLLTDDPIRVAVIVLDLTSRGVIYLEGDDEALLLQEASKTAPAAVWILVGDAIESGDPAITVTAEGWVLEYIPWVVVEEWIGTNETRAKRVARMVRISLDGPSVPLTSLLTKFGANRDVYEALLGRVITGGWVGPYSQHLSGKILALKAWDPPEQEVRAWVDDAIALLEARLAQATIQEAEDEIW